MSINKRFKEIIEYLEGGNKTAFCRNCGIKPTTLSSIVGARQSDPSAKLLNCVLNAYPDINALWLLTGRGGMLNGQALENQKTSIEQTSKNVPCKECAGKDIIIKNLIEQVDDLREDKQDLKDQIKEMKDEPTPRKRNSA